jgi:hypothetical protein
MTMTHIPGSQIGPSDDDRDVAIARISYFGISAPLDIVALERETGLRDAAIEFGAAIQHFVPDSERREQAWISLEDSYFRGIQAISAPNRHMEA